MAGYNPYRKENGEFASKGELGGVESKVEADLTAARSADDSERADEIERYAMDKLPESKLGKSLLEARYGAAPAPTAPKPSVSPEARYEEIRESLSAIYTDENASGLDLEAAEERVGEALKALSERELVELRTHSLRSQSPSTKDSFFDSYTNHRISEELKRRDLEHRKAVAVSPEDHYENLRESLSASGDHRKTREIGMELLERSDAELDSLEAHAKVQFGAKRPGLVWDMGVETAVRTEKLRRTQREAFAQLTELGYEYDGTGGYTKSGEEGGKRFFVASRPEVALTVRDGRVHRKIGSTEELLAEAGGSAKPSSARIPKNIAPILKAAGVKRPMNWDEMGSSAKDRWEEAQYRALNR